jgi:hypothetical protein
MAKYNKVLLLLVMVTIFIPISQYSYSQTIETIQNILETPENFTRISGTIEYGNNNSELSANSTSLLQLSQDIENNASNLDNTN